MVLDSMCRRGKAASGIQDIWILVEQWVKTGRQSGKSTA